MNRFSINGRTKLYGIVGNPVSHSFSPEMHTLAFQHLQLNSVYLPFPVQEPELPKLLEAFQLLGVQGFNVTVPYKEKIVPLLPELSPEAQFLKTVNTVKRTAAGWKGFCTDGIGFTRTLQIRNIDLTNKRVLMLGAGGAAKAIAFALVNSGIRSLDIFNRTESKAAELKNRLQDFNKTVEVQVGSQNHDFYDLLVNTTSVGMDGKGNPAAKALIRACKMIVDIIYFPPLTPLLTMAKEAGIPYYNGIDMLLYQGVEAFEIWTGQTAPVEVMRESLKNSLALDQ